MKKLSSKKVFIKIDLCKEGRGRNMEVQEKIANRIAEELNIKLLQVTKTIQLIDEGNTIPFIARYRKEVTRWTFR